MEVWDYGENKDSHFRFDFMQSFDEQVSRLKSSSGGAFKRGSHNYYVLLALFRGHTIDDYANRPMGGNGYPVNNVRTRVAQLRKEWNICIGSRRADGAPYKEYQIYGRGA